MSIAKRAAVVFGALAVVCACGKTGSPLPPLPRGPFEATDVVVRQVGNEVRVRYGVPPRRGERPKQELAGAELWRVGWPAGVEPVSDPGLFARRGDVVAVEAADGWNAGERRMLVDPRALPDDLGATLRYAVRLRDRAGRSSPLVVAPDLFPLPPLAPPASPAADPVPIGVRVSWGATADDAVAYNVYRRRPGDRLPEQPLNDVPIVGGMFEDVTVETDERYRYSVRAVLAEGQPRREGRASDEIEVVAIDLFPPAAPQGLVAVQEGAGVKLFWDPNDERDLSGYRVYRRLSGGEWTGLATEGVNQPNWLDSGVSLGDSAEYRVTAIDEGDPPNESEPSAVVEIDLLTEPSSPGGGVAP